MQIGDIAFDHGTLPGNFLKTSPGIPTAAALDGRGSLFEGFARAPA
jgi:hypothetical protein